MLRSLAQIFLLTALAITTVHAGPNSLPPELNRALILYRAEGPPLWGFIQTSEAGRKSLVEHFDPSKPEFSRWTLLKKDGRPPTESDQKEYQDQLSRRTSGGTAPNVKDQIDPSSCELVSNDDVCATYRFHLKPTEKGDRSAAHMTATFTLNKPTGVIERVEIAAFEPFSPMLTVKITEAKTIIIYSVPTADKPTLLQKITVSIRGHAMWVKSLDEDMTVTYSDHTFVGRKTAATTIPGTENPARPGESAH